MTRSSNPMDNQPHLNLIDDPWLPVRRRSGRTETIAPWAVNDRIDTDPVTAFSWPRPELNATSVELLIGMLSTAAQPAGDPEWQWGWTSPPGPEALRERFGRIAPFFELVAEDAPAFLQDLDPLAGASLWNPAQLLFDTPGARTARLNTDLFRRRADDDTVLSLPAAAIGLYALMSWCASGGVGHRVALRGGGPLVTLPILGHRLLGDTLWGQLWPAVRTPRPGETDWTERPERVFAWLAPTPTSRPEEANPPLGPDDMHPQHVHWGMPRRVRLLAGPAAGRPCAVTGEQPVTAIVGVRVRNYGINYASGYPHPHTPHYRTSITADPLPMLTTARSARGERLAGLVETLHSGLRGPASAIYHFAMRAGRPETADPRMRCFGIDADKAKVRGWIDTTIPLPLAGTLAGTNAVTTCLHPLCDALGDVGSMLNKAIRRAAPPAAAGSAADTARARLADTVEPALFEAWREAAESEHATPRAADRRLDPGLGSPPDPTDPSRSIRAAFMRHLQQAALALFDELVPAAGVEHRDPFRQAEARHGLVLDIGGRTTRGRKLFAETVGLPVPADARSQPAPARVAPAPHPRDRSLRATAWRWRNELEATSAGMADLARLGHAHTLEQARGIDAAKTLAGQLEKHCGADTAAVMAVALALTREDGAFTAAHLAGGRGTAHGARLPRPAFRSLLQTPRNGLLEPLRRLLAAIPDRRADRRTLADDIAQWGPRVRLGWTHEYLHCRTEPWPAIAYEQPKEDERA